MKFDIATPSFNQVRYLRETIESVLSQKSPNVDVSYYVMDGGSTDGSVDLIRSYEASLAFWRSEQDDGQAAAIAEGLAMGDGDIVAWINSDDCYPPGAFEKVAECFRLNPQIDLIYGDCLMIDEQSKPVGLGTHIPVSWQDLFETPYLVNQESTFVRRGIYEKVGGVDLSYWGAMDYDLWLRLFYEGKAFYLQEILGIHRFLRGQKSSTSELYIKEMQQAREKFASRYALPIASWPTSKEGWERVRAKWELHWAIILEWIKRGCIENEFNGPVVAIWQKYAQNGVLSVRGGTSFGWLGPEALYVLDRKLVGSSIQWTFGSPSPGLSADRLSLNVDGTSWTLELHDSISHLLSLPGDKRFVLVQIDANKAFVPALENSGPAYCSLSLTSNPRPKGNGIISVQSIPCLPEIESLFEQIKAKDDTAEELDNESVAPSVKTSCTLEHSLKERPLKVAFFTSHPVNVGSGCERLIYNTASGLVARGHDARVYVMNATMDRMPPFFARQLPTLPLERQVERRFSKITGWNDILFPSTGLLRFRRWIGTADIWHFHNLHGHYVSIPLLALVSWTKRVVISPVDHYLSTGYCTYTMDCERYLDKCGSCGRLSEPWPGISRDATSALLRFKRLFFRFSRVKMLFHTEALSEHYENTFVKSRTGKVIHYGVDLTTYRKLSRSDCARRLGVKPNRRFVVGVLHSHLLEARKGILTIIEGLDNLARQYPGKFSLLVVGRGNELVKDHVSPELSVTALPYLHHAHELANALNLCDVVLYPTQAENLSLTCLNALACGVPVISFDAGGQKEAIKDGMNGFIVNMNDSEGMLGLVRKMIENPVLCESLSREARRYAEMKFDFDRYIDDLMKYYYEMI